MAIGLLPWFALGAIIGSFLNVLIARYQTGESFIRGRSHCPKCHHQLELFDLIPVLSFAFLRGRCRYCWKPISWQYPLVELATGGLFALIAYESGGLLTRYWNIFGTEYIFGAPVLITEMIVYLAVASLTIVLFVTDLRRQILPDRFVWPLVALAATLAVLHGSQWRASLLGAAAGVGVTGLIYLLSSGKAMGLGDVKLMIALGLLSGWPHLLVLLFCAFVGGGIVGGALLLLKRAKLKSRIAFGIFLLPAFWLALFWGDTIIAWYLKLGQ